MTPEIIFTLCSNLAIVGWIIMAVAPRWKFTHLIVTSGAISLLLGGVYFWIIVTTFGDGEGNFSSLQGVMQLFENPNAVLAGWIHYLAFDLFIGSWILRDSQRHAIHHLIIVPVLFLTLMFGPIGLMIYGIIRAIKTKVVLHDNF